MQKLAIFGDSYAKKDATDILEKSWHEFIEGYEITNFGVTGSDLYTSYNLFLNNYKEFDHIIFLVTSPHRISLTSPNTIIYPHQNYNSAKIRSKVASGSELEQYQAVINYYELLTDQNKDKRLHQLMVNDIIRLAPRTILYPCFWDSWYNVDIKDFPLYSVTQFEDQFWGMNDEKRNDFYLKKLRDSRACHMTESNNRLVATMFVDRLQSKDSSIRVDHLFEPRQELEYYYQSRWL
jgi:hypothetical protein